MTSLGCHQLRLALGVISISAIALAGCTSTLPAGSAPPLRNEAATTVPASQCSSFEILGLAGNWNGKAGGSSGFVIFNNVGHVTCLFQGGLPVVEFIGTNGDVVGRAGAESPSRTPTLEFRLAPSSGVGARIDLPDPNVVGPASCRLVSTVDIKIATPDGSSSFEAPFPGGVCAGASAGVSPIQNLAGIDGY
jgi:hypothetical protein